MKPFEFIEVIHPWTKETNTLQVITVTKTFVTVKWGMSGAYDLNLLQNVLTSRSLKARNRGPCLWRAVDIEAVRESVRNHLAKEDIKESVRVAARLHVESMPHQVKKV